MSIVCLHGLSESLVKHYTLKPHVCVDIHKLLNFLVIKFRLHHLHNNLVLVEIFGVDHCVRQDHDITSLAVDLFVHEVSD